VHVSVETPSKLNSDEKELLKKLAELRGESLTVTEEEREADAEREASKKSKETQAKTDKKAKSKSKEKDEPVKEDSSIIDKIGEFFRPKNGDNEE
jgi:DNA replication initiation complex subunit (GINS family)